MKKKIITMIIFILILGTVYPMTRNIRIIKLEYNKNNNLIKIINFDQFKKQKINEKEIIYDDKNKITRYVTNGKTSIYFKYNSQGKIKTIETFPSNFELNYKNGVIISYDLINYTPNGGRNFTFPKKSVLDITKSRLVSFLVVKNGKVNLSKVTSETFNYSNNSTEIIENNRGEIIKQIWGSKKDTQYHVKYFYYDYNGNLVTVKAVDKVKIIPFAIDVVLTYLGWAVANFV